MTPPRPRRLAATCFLAALTALALGACQQKPQRPACPAGKACLEYGNSNDPSTLDPQKSTLTTEFAIIGELIQGLTENGPDGNPVPGMAERWETSSDGLVWTFHLRPATWSDGTPVTAGDFVFSYRRMLDPATGSSYAYLLYLLKNGEAINEGHASPDTLGARALDPRTLQLTLEHPAPYLLQLTQHQSYYPVPPQAVKRWGDAWSQPGHFVSNGPYLLTAWRLGDYLRIEKNPNYYDAGKVCIDRIDFYPTGDAIAAERRVKRGELDVSNTFAGNRLARLRKTMPDYVRIHPYLATTYVTFNTKDVPAFKDVRVRQALSMAIDRDFITQKLMRDGATSATGFVPPGIANYDFSAHFYWTNLTYPQRQALARRLLAAAGYGPGHPLKFELLIPGIGSGTSIVAESIQNDWKTIGVEAKLTQAETQVAFEDLNMRSFQAGVAGWIADYDDAKTYLDLLKSGTGQQNYGDYNNPAYDALLDRADHEPDGVKRAHLLSQAEQLVLDDSNIAPVLHGVNHNLVNPRITGWVDNVVDIHRALYLCLKDAPPRP